MAYDVRREALGFSVVDKDGDILEYYETKEEAEEACARCNKEEAFEYEAMEALSQIVSTLSHRGAALGFTKDQVETLLTDALIECLPGVQNGLSDES